ncbi:unnamed protein product [Ceutorhynchus assimilis]|uniref:C2H2-type domain-containing protein n=1 Tax=Ceutorhynchus assimilis TaxID=467358 RepID=A0A9N9MG25_9CUCU|nr:unnamed protein product [Ceutorhynchus assimilis]
MEVKDEKSEIPFCRLCLSTSVVYYSLLKQSGKEMLHSLTGIQVDGELQSTESCVKCWLDLKSAYQTQQRFVKAEETFQLNGLESVKSRFNLAKKSTSDLSIEPEPVTNITETETTPELDDLLELEQSSSHENEIEEIIENDSENEDYGEVIYIEHDDDSSLPEIKEEPKPACFICGIKCESEAAMYSHTNDHYKEEQLCDTCLISLPNIPAYMEHIESHHPELANRTYCCGICSLSFRYMPLYDLHLAAVHPSTAKTERKRKRNVAKYLPEGSTLKCDECNKTYSTKQSYNSHIKGHLKKPCPICKNLITIYNLNKHITNHNAGPAVCHLCGITTKNPESLRGHMYYTHSQKRLKCETCGRIFKKLYAFKMHIKKEHTGDRSFTCDACGKRFFTKYELNQHIRTRHLKERNHICQYCHRGFSSRFSMRTHERQHTNETPYMCDVCGEGFRQNVSLRAHKKSKHNIIETKNAECSICSKMFKDDWALKSHVRSVHD